MSDSISGAPRPAFEAESLAASFTVDDLARSVAWYCDVLGFVVEREHAREGRLVAVSLGAGTTKLLLTQDNGALGGDRVKGGGFSLQFTTRQDVDMLADAARRAGATFDTEPTDQFGARVFRLRDPDGFRLVISSVRKG